VTLHDAETGLPGATLALDRLGVATRRCVRTGAAVALLLVDPGDKPQIAAQRLSDVVRSGDTVARIGPGTLALIVDDLQSLADVEAVAGRALGQLDGAKAAIGVAIAAGEARAAEEMLSEAQRALARAQAQGGGVELFDVEIHERALDQAQGDAELRQAIASGELLLHYQPIVGTEDGLMRGVEALVRWEHSEHGLLGPNEFVPVAEASGAIVPLGDWVLRDACRQVKAWQATRAEADELWLAVNVSRSQLGHPSFVASVQRALLESGLAAERLYLEIAQGDLAAAGDLVGVLRQLQANGVRISIDDADGDWQQAVGAASVQMVKARPDEIEAVLAATPREVDVVAQRIEDREHEERLRDHGCRLAQGFLYARPAPANEIDALLAAVPAALPAQEEVLVES
jgi:EAL domain-containing protein (putative c-di-GMP-specific phosphodiesterase class I)